MKNRVMLSWVAAGAMFLFALIAPGRAESWRGAFPEGVEAFRILFVTSETLLPQESDIAWYDDYVSDRVEAVPELAALNADWKCLGSTAAAAVKTHTQTDPAVNGAGVPIYRTDGTLFAADNTALWSGSVGAGLGAFRNEWGVSEYYFDATGGDERFGYVWTGSTADGSPSANPLGSVQVTVGRYLGPSWFSDSTWPTNSLSFPVYGISGIIRASDIPLETQESETFFVRARGPGTTRITDFSPDGILSWSNSVMSGICTVEVASAFGESNEQWNAYTALQISNTLTEARIRDPRVPENMSLIPAGTFSMGDGKEEGSRFELPVHEVTVSEFWMDRTETSNDDMAELLNWANLQGRIRIDGISVYSTVGQPQLLLVMHNWWSRIGYDGTNFVMRIPNGEGHPVINVTWWGAINYCNWRSEVEGLDPCYELNAPSCDWEKSGYRLPTEAEWERAARGGRSGERFPSGGDTIGHSWAIYYSRWSSSGGILVKESPYDEASAPGLHPNYDTYAGWDPPVPQTAPVASLARNGYGLYHMAGNVREWCWDKNDVQANDPYRYYYESSPDLDPRGADGPDRLTRVYRGAGWSNDTGASSARCSSWSHGPWQRTSEDLGFRTVRRRLILEPE